MPGTGGFTGCEILNAKHSESQANWDKLITLVFPQDIPEPDSHPHLSDSTCTLQTASKGKKEARFKWGPVQRPLLAACLGPPSPHGLQAGGNGHEDVLAQGPWARKVTSEQVLGSPHPQHQAGSPLRGRVPASAHSPSLGLLSLLSRANVILSQFIQELGKTWSAFSLESAGPPGLTVLGRSGYREKSSRQAKVSPLCPSPPPSRPLPGPQDPLRHPLPLKKAVT